MSFDMRSIIVYIIGLVIIFLLLKLFKKPLVWVLRLLFSCVIGIAVLFVFNLLLSKTGVTIPINPFNALTIGVMGAPGLALLWILAVLV